MLNIINILRSYLLGLSTIETAPIVANPKVLEECPYVKYFSKAEHHLYMIWITPEIAPREPINDVRLNNLKHTKQVLGPEWEVTLFTNNKTLIPKSVTKLSEIGIDIEEFSELKPTTCKPNFYQSGLFKTLDALKGSTLEEVYENLSISKIGVSLYNYMVSLRGTFAALYGQYENHKEEWEKGAKKILLEMLLTQQKKLLRKNYQD